MHRTPALISNHVLSGVFELRFRQTFTQGQKANRETEASNFKTTGGNVPGGNRLISAVANPPTIATAASASVQDERRP
jgi:hypothetical protein